MTDDFNREVPYLQYSNAYTTIEQQRIQIVRGAKIRYSYELIVREASLTFRIQDFGKSLTFIRSWFSRPVNRMN